MARRWPPDGSVPGAECGPDADARSRGVVIWYVDLARGGDALLALEAETPRLAASDHHRAARLGGGDPEHPHARARRAAYVALRLALERAFGTSPVRGREMARSELGRPSLAGCPGDFSQTHAAGHALIGVVHKGSIGVDLEQSRRIRMTEARRTAIERAGACLDAAAPLPQASPDRFLTAWVRLEAFAKAQRTSMARVLTAAGALGGGATPAAAEVLGKLRAAIPFGSAGEASGACVVRDLIVTKGLFGAMALRDDSIRDCGAPAPAIRPFPVTLDALRQLGR